MAEFDIATTLNQLLAGFPYGGGWLAELIERLVG